MKQSQHLGLDWERLPTVYILNWIRIRGACETLRAISSPLPLHGVYT